jgi:hypothetical protein
VRSRFAPILAGLITLAMVVFGQVCAYSRLVTSVGETTAAASVETVPVPEDHASTCDPAGCESEGERDNGSGCPSGAASCCSTWGPPSVRLSLTPPVSVPLFLADLWLIADDIHALAERASEVALFELARPPGLSTDALLASSVSRRGPPALT